jgi:predicted DNA-binding WGR domain protein
MSVDRFFLDGFQNEAAYETLKDSPVFPLVRELEFKYGLKVVKSLTDGSGNKYWRLAHKNGTAVGVVWARANDQGQMEYHYRSPHFIKDRGESRADKETLRSVKISALMATMTRRGVIPDAEALTRRHTRQLRNAVELMKRALGKSNKDSTFTNDEIHALLLMALGGSPNSEWVKVDQNKCQEALDKYEEADRVSKVKRQEVERVFRNPFYMIGVDGYGEYLIGKFKLSAPTTDEDYMKWETVEDFKRYRSYEQVPELIPLMTMVKVAYENSQHSKVGVLPVTDLYDEGLDAAFFYNSSPDAYNCAWMVTSCT